MNLTQHNVMEQMTWTQIAVHVSETDGNTIGRERARQLGERALKRVVSSLMDDPHVRDWLFENAKDLLPEDTNQ